MDASELELVPWVHTTTVNQAFGNDESTWQLPHAIREVCLLVGAVLYCSS